MSDHRSAPALREAVAQCLAVLGDSSARRVEPTIVGFLAFLETQGIDHLDVVTEESCSTFIGSRLQSGQPASLATQHNRRSALRAIFNAARREGLVAGDPTIDLDLPPAQSPPTRPLTDVEVDSCRDVAWWSSSRVAAAWALAEATARGSEIAEVTAVDIDLDRSVVRLPGGARTEPRTGELTDWGTEHFNGECVRWRWVPWRIRVRAARTRDRCRRVVRSVRCWCEPVSPANLMFGRHQWPAGLAVGCSTGRAASRLRRWRWVFGVLTGRLG